MSHHNVHVDSDFKVEALVNHGHFLHKSMATQISKLL
jgi:hypothetical protein